MLVFIILNEKDILNNLNNSDVFFRKFINIFVIYLICIFKFIICIIFYIVYMF